MSLLIARLCPSAIRSEIAPGGGREPSRQASWRLWPLLFAAALLTGCAGTGTETSRYTLPVSQFAVEEVYENNAVDVLVVEPIRMASYLNSEGIVMQLSDIEVLQARNHLWAESLGRQLERSLRQQLSAALPNTRVLTEARAAGDEPLRLRIDLDQFQGRYDGRAVVSGQWQVRNGQGEILSQDSFSVERVLESDGYPALVRSLAQAWNEVAGIIAEDLAQLRR